MKGLKLKKLTSDIGLNVTRQVLKIVMLLALSIIIARWLGPDGNGKYTLAVLLPTFLARFINIGIMNANSYYVGRKSLTLREALRLNWLLCGVLTGIGVTIGILVVLFFQESFFRDLSSFLLFTSLIAFPFFLVKVFMSSLLQAAQDFKKYNIVLLVEPVVILVLVVIFLIGVGKGVTFAVVSFICGQFFAAVFAIIFVRRKANSFEGDNTVNEDKRLSGLSTKFWAYISYGGRAHLSNVLTFLNYRADLFLINYFINPAATGIYVIAVQLAERLWLLSRSVGAVILPRLSELESEEDKRKYLTPLISRWVFLLTFAAAAALAVLSHFIITKFFGVDYESATVPLLILLPGIIIGSSARILSNDITARGMPEINFYVAACTVCLNILLNVFLIPMYGIKGAAIATTLTYFADGVTKVIIYKIISSNQKASVFIPSAKEIGRLIKYLKN